MVPQCSLWFDNRFSAKCAIKDKGSMTAELFYKYYFLEQIKTTETLLEHIHFLHTKPSIL